LLTIEYEAKDSSRLIGDTETVVCTEADKPENGACSIGDHQLAALLKNGILTVGQEVADKPMALHAKGTKHIAFMDGAEGQRELYL
jgi:hypothetical protein